jgi:hypothetical protein
VTSFELAGESSVASTALGDDAGNLVSSSLVRWSPGNGALLATVASDATAATVYETIGRDAALNTALAIRWPWNGSVQTLETFDTRDWRKLGSVDVDAWAQDWIIAARIDPVHHRAALLAYDPNFALQMLPFDLARRTIGPAVLPTLGPDDFSFYNTLAVDPLNGKAFITAGAVTDFCLFRSGPLTSVDLDSGATFSTPIDSCTTALVADGRKVHVTHGPLLSNGILLPVASLQDVDERTMKASPTAMLGARSPIFPAVDGDHQLLVVGFIAGDDYELNSNATSAVGAYDLRSGRRVSYSTAFNFAQVALGGVLDPLTLRGIQLDSRTRTGWTIGPASQQLQQFSY